MTDGAAMPLVSMPANPAVSVRFLGNVDYVEPWVHFARTLNEYILYIVASGTLYIEEDGVRYTLRKNDWLLLEPGKPHCGFRPSVCHYYYIHFSAAGLETKLWTAEEIKAAGLERLAENQKSSDYDFCPCDFLPLLFLKNGHLSNGEAVFRRLSQIDQDFFARRPGRRALCAAGTEEILVLLARTLTEDCLPEGNPDHMAEEIKSYLLGHYAELRSIQELSAVFHLHPDALNRIYRRATGGSLYQTLLGIRIDRAKQLLLVTDQKIGAVSNAVGFSDPLYFSRCFKKRTGQTPGAYRAAGGIETQESEISAD